MNLGQPSVFAPGDTDADRARKLNGTFASVWRLLQLVQGGTTIVQPPEKVFGHTSEMPDNNGLNHDHDRRYYVNGRELHPRRVRQNSQPTPRERELLVWSDSTTNNVWLVYNDPDGGTVKVQLT